MLDKLPRLAGILMLLLLVTLLVASFTGETPDTDADEFADGVRTMLLGNEGKFIVGQVATVVAAVLVFLVGVALYSIFRAREQVLAVVTLNGFLVETIALLANAVAYTTVFQLARDMDRSKTIAGDNEVLEIARTVAQMGDGMFFLGLIFFGLALIATGAMILRSKTAPVAAATAGDVPAAAFSPPVWLGWIAMIAGACFPIGLLTLASEWLFLFIALGFLLTLIWLLAFGIWLIRQGSNTTQEVAAVA